MANHHGTEGTVEVGANEVGELVSFDLEETSDYDEDSALQDSWDTYNATPRKKWRGSLTCHFDENDTNGQEALTNGTSVTLHLLPAGNGTGDPDLNGTALVTAVRYGVVRAGIVSRTIDFLGSGALTYGTHA